MPRWVGDVLEAIFIIGLGAVVFAIFFYLFTGGNRGKNAMADSSSLAGKIKGYADSVVSSAQKDIDGVNGNTVAPRFATGINNVANFLLK